MLSQGLVPDPRVDSELSGAAILQFHPPVIRELEGFRSGQRRLEVRGGVSFTGPG